VKRRKERMEGRAGRQNGKVAWVRGDTTSGRRGNGPVVAVLRSE
jgi:hypothetical protein